MDIALLRTFLEVAKVRHFGKAAETLCVTQSAVSARIKQLESTLGVDLFIRKRGDIQLTLAGNRLQRHAETIVKGWARARQDIAMESSLSDSIAIGCMNDLWDILLKGLCLQLAHQAPEMLLQVEILTRETLVQRLTSGLLDLVFMFEPPQMSELSISKVMEVPLVMVSSRQGLCAADAVHSGYTLVDWGNSFASLHAEYFPDAAVPMMRTGSGGLAYDLIRQQGGTAYLAEQMVAGALEQGQLFRVADAPVIERQVYRVVRPESEHRKPIRSALACLQAAGVC
ncbi:LysR family transcriptional regulator [Sedimenticola hydrogenitrophicus]|uniref:LysR family transcriptional regulator n=1 Tax=Sedimenticola hydrogenitrophicus TaxID=2967975 RepID=UPI0021A4FD9F|nr:LysR family transcriptional regulator [Sedimenticola hydrogenitrophicus]